MPFWECAVCLEDDDITPIVKCNRCGQYLHLFCAQKCKGKCPLCRSDGAT